MHKLLYRGNRVTDNETIEGFLSWNHNKTKYFIGRWIDVSSHGGTVKKRIEEEVIPETVVMDTGFKCDFLYRGKKNLGEDWIYGYFFWDEQGESFIGERRIKDGVEVEVLYQVFKTPIQFYTGKRDAYNRKIFSRHKLKVWDVYGEMSGVASYYNGAFYFKSGKILKNFNKISYMETDD